MNINTWWTWSAAEGDTVDITIDEVTLIFDQKIYVDASTGVVVPGEEETTEPSEETTEPSEETTEPSEETTESTEDSSVSDEAVYGDVNLDGKVSIADVLTLNKNLMAGEALSEEAQKNADVDRDGKPTSADALNLLKYTIKVVDTLPVA